MVRADRRSAFRGLVQAGLLAPAAFTVHELRYLMAFGPNAGIELQRQGHSYLHSVAPWIALVAALVAGAPSSASRVCSPRWRKAASNGFRPTAATGAASKP